MVSFWWHHPDATILLNYSACYMQKREGALLILMVTPGWYLFALSWYACCVCAILQASRLVKAHSACVMLPLALVLNRHEVSHSYCKTPHFFNVLSRSKHIFFSAVMLSGCEKWMQILRQCTKYIGSIVSTVKIFTQHVKYTAFYMFFSLNCREIFVT